MRWQVPSRQKLIHFLQNQLTPSPSGKQLRRALEANLCRVNGAIERFGSTEVEKHAIVELSPSWQREEQGGALDWNILYEDAECLAVDKPAGWVCAESACRLAFGPSRFLLHRLDKETTGILLIAKSREAEQRWISLFRERAIEKSYLALVDGLVAPESGTVDNFLAKKGAFQGQTLWGSSPRGLAAVTHWKVLARGSNATLLLCRPITGRTHQIRVHLSEMGHPILIDRQYAKTFRSKAFFSRPLLHAAKLRFSHPTTGEALEIEAPLPKDWTEALKTCGIIFS